MCMPYENAADANQHLQGTVVMFDGRPVYVHDVFASPNGIQTTLLFLPRMSDEITVPLFDPRFEAKEVGNRLGYMNYGGRVGAIYTRRIPARQYKQGLTRGNVMIGNRTSGHRFAFGDIIRMGQFVDMMTRTYPTYDMCFKMMEENAELPSIAFSPDFALVRQDLGFYILSYKGDQIAWGDPGKFKLPKQYSYLRELLDSYGVPYDA